MPLLPRNVLYYGTEKPLPAQKELQAGPLSLIFEDGDLRYIRYGEKEIVRRIYVAVRDRNWGTVPPNLSNLKVEQKDDAFLVSYDCEHRQGEIDFFWKCAIEGDARGRISFQMDGQARSSFFRNRIGFCVLHPIRECAGFPCSVEKADGSFEKGRFPKSISPHQPFKNMRAVSHEVAEGVQAEVRFSGEIFEMEDHRNWTDASYKTYGTPLSLPFPVEIRQGTKISQSVVLTLKGKPLTPRKSGQARAPVFSVSPSVSHPLPKIGLGVASHGQPLTSIEIDRLRGLQISHLRVDLDLASAAYLSRLRQAAAEAAQLGVPLEVAVFVSDAAAGELRNLKAALGEIKPEVARWLLFHSGEKTVSEKWARLGREALAGYSAKARVGGGSNHYFTEINRFRPPVGILDLVSYSINPQVHSFDIPALVENLEAQAMTVEAARPIIGKRPLVISLVTLRPRFSAAATGPELPMSAGTLPFAVDERQMSLFGAGWTAGSLKYLCESGVASATYYETTGWRGVMEQAAGSPEPKLFRSVPGSVFPVYHVLADFGEFAPGAVIPTQTSDPLKFDGIAIHKDHKTRVILANFTPESQTVSVRNLTERVRVRPLNEGNAEEAMIAPEKFRNQEAEEVKTAGGVLEARLPPFGLVRIDSV